jgi:hypothetical protein
MRKITLNESEMINFVSMLIEQVNLNGYTDEDFIEVFVNLFRPWVKSNHGDEVSKYPMSYLVKKYIDEFISDIKLDVSDFRYESGLKKFVKIGRDIVRHGKYELPSLNSNKKFTERFKKHLDYFISNFDVPDYVKFEITEDSPNDVDIVSVVDFQKLIKSDNTNVFSTSSFSKNLQKYLENYLGVEFGSPVHGKLDLYIPSTPKYVGVEEWIKNEFNRNIKKQIKELPSANRNISSLKFILTTSYRLGGEIKIGWKRDSRWSEHHDVKKSVRELLSNMGYNTEILEVTST